MSEIATGSLNLKVGKITIPNIEHYYGKSIKFADSLPNIRHIEFTEFDDGFFFLTDENEPMIDLLTS